MALWVRLSSSAARVKLWCRAADSKATRAAVLGILRRIYATASLISRKWPAKTIPKCGLCTIACVILVCLLRRCHIGSVTHSVVAARAVLLHHLIRGFHHGQGKLQLDRPAEIG